MATKKTAIWFRRVVPPGYATAELTLTGTAPLLMHSAEYDRDGELYRAYFLLGKKKGKSLDDEARLREMEWKLGLYFDETIGPYIPGKNVKEVLRLAATKWRRGEDIKRSLVVIDNRIPLTYEGPRDEDGLWEAGFRYTAMVSNSGIGSGRVSRCRPAFDQWSLKVDIAYDPEDLDYEFLQVVVDRSTKYGLGDYRPTFGAFMAELQAGSVQKASSNGSATKRRNAREATALAAFNERIMTG